MNENFPEFVKQLDDWHPIKTYFKENKALNNRILTAENILKKKIQKNIVVLKNSYLCRELIINFYN